MIDFLKELWGFMKVRKKFWLAPIIFVLILLGALIVFSEGSAVAPFIYTLFQQWEQSKWQISIIKALFLRILCLEQLYYYVPWRCCLLCIEAICILIFLIFLKRLPAFFGVCKCKRSQSSPVKRPLCGYELCFTCRSVRKFQCTLHSSSSVVCKKCLAHT